MGTLLMVGGVPAAPERERIGIIASEPSWLPAADGLAPAHITIVESSRIAAALVDLRKGGARCEVNELSCVSRVAAWARLSAMVSIELQGGDLVASRVDPNGSVTAATRSPDGSSNQRADIARALVHALLFGEAASGKVVIEGANEVMVDGEIRKGPTIELPAGPHMVGTTNTMVRAGLASTVIVAAPAAVVEQPMAPVVEPEPSSPVLPFTLMGASVVVAATGGVVAWLLIPSAAEYEAGNITAADYNSQQRVAAIVAIGAGALALTTFAVGVGLLIVE